MNHKKFSALAVATMAWLAYPSNADPEQGVEDLPDQTIIVEKPPEKSDVKHTFVKDKTADQRPGDASMLFHIPGLTLSESGGPLAPSQIRYRGLSNARFRVDLEGLTLNNPLNGLNDANSMFLFAAKNLQTNAQSLSITLPRFTTAEVKGVFGYGSHNTMKLGAIVGTPLDEYSSLMVATQASATEGNFSYASPDLSKGPENNFVRENNDQHRVQALANYQRVTTRSRQHVLLAVSAHEGGIAGMAFSPTKELRNQAVYSGLKFGGAQKINKAEFSIDVTNSLFNYRSTAPEQKERFTTSTHEITFGVNSLQLPPWLDFDFSEQLVIEHAYELKKTRIGGGILMRRVMRMPGRMKPTINVQFNMLGFNQQGFLFKKDFGFTFEPLQMLSVTARFIRHQRLPTFMEMYANNRYFMGNDQLNKESVWDLELGSTLRLQQHTRFFATAFLGYLSDVIVYVPFLATRVRPQNVQSARRYGIDFGFMSEPFSWLAFESKNSALNTKNAATNAPLPHAPPFLGLTSIRIGMEEIVAVSLQSRYRASSMANIYGTLASKPYVLFDTVISARPLKLLGISFSVSNIFNVKTARDTYETPLPGTVFFGQIEVGNS